MAIFSFTQNILSGKPTILFNDGNMLRDFTYIDDVTHAISKFVDIVPTQDSNPPYQIYNIGNSNPISVKYVIELIEKNIGKKAIIECQQMHVADVVNTDAETTKIEKCLGELQHTPIEIGIKNFVRWYQRYYEICAMS